MSRTLKVCAGIVGGIVLLLVVVAVAVDGDETSPTANPTTTAAEAEPDIRLVAASSECTADPATAQILFVFTLRNDGDAGGDVDVRPWRRYSDNKVNDSVVDTLEVTVPAGESRRFSAEFGYDAEAHRLIECGLMVGGETEPTMISVG